MIERASEVASARGVPTAQVALGSEEIARLQELYQPHAVAGHQ